MIVRSFHKHVGGTYHTVLACTWVPCMPYPNPLRTYVRTSARGYVNASHTLRRTHAKQYDVCTYVPAYAPLTPRTYKLKLPARSGTHTHKCIATQRFAMRLRTYARTEVRGGTRQYIAVSALGARQEPPDVHAARGHGVLGGRAGRPSRSEWRERRRRRLACDADTSHPDTSP